jgi:hypothetical protein
MANYLVAPPTAPKSWRINVSDFELWLQHRWTDIEPTPDVASSQRRYMWTWPDQYEVWVPDHRDCAWIAADLERAAAVATWLASNASEPLILCDEGYSFDIDLSDANEATVLQRLRER